MSKVLSEEHVAKLTPKERKALQKNLAKTPVQPSPSPQKPTRSGPGLMFFLVYGIACAVGGIYFDRALMPKARIWLGGQAENLAGYGSEQKILGVLEQTGYSSAEQKAAQANVQTVFQLKRDGALTSSETEDLARATAIFQDPSPSRKSIDQALEIFAALTR